MSEFRGARGSNTGDDFHELWATRQAIRLLSNDDDLEAIAVEGLAASDEAGAPEDTWDGVDCTLYFGGATGVAARHVSLEQLKYSGANPETVWTVARLVGGARRAQSVIARLAKAWKGLAELRPSGAVPASILISNQPVAPEVISAFARAALAPLAVPKTKPKATAADEAKLAYAAGLSAAEFQSFSGAIQFGGGAGSRFAIEEKALQAIADWTDQDIQRVVTGLRQFVRQRMRPEFAGELITRESVMLHLGASEGAAIFPCPSEISRTEEPVSRAPIREVTRRLLLGVQHLCLHGRGGVGKTTALQEIEGNLPLGSIMIKYDCYGGGRYMDPSALRHRSIDAFLQLTNELAARLTLPLLLSRHQGSDYPRLFANRLKHAANAVAAQQPGALIVIAIDAADNAVIAAQKRVPAEASFIHDFVLLAGQPGNVRFVVTARTGRLESLLLSPLYQSIEIEPFSRQETSENVCRIWPAPEHWIDDFHHLSSGVPRVQAYAFKVDGAHPLTALDRLRPAGKSLDEVFRQQFGEALRKSGNATEVARLCAGLIALPRPVPLLDLASVLSSTEALLTDICVDLAPGIRLHDGTASFADEDFEDFVRTEGVSQLHEVQQAAASWLLSRAPFNRYAAMNVAASLVSANRGAELLELVEREPAPATIADPVLRREAELQRLRLAIKVCREARDVPRALRFVLIGAEGAKTEAAIRELLVSNPDMAANFAQETAGRLILADPDHIEDHGPLLFQKLSVDAARGDAISVREGRRLLKAWMQARDHQIGSAEKKRHRRKWEISIPDISSAVNAKLKLDGPAAALQALESWRPRRIALDVALSLPLCLIAEGRVREIEAVLADEHLEPIGILFLLIPLAIAGSPIDIDLLARGLAQLIRHKLKLETFFNGYNDESSHGWVLDAALTACEILTCKSAAPELVDTLLDSFLLPKLRRIERRQSHETMKLDFLFRAHSLRGARAGRKASAKDIFEPRPKETDEGKRRSAIRKEEEHDRPLMELTGAVFDIYAVVGDALVNRKTDIELNESLRAALAGLERETWRISRQHGSIALREYAANSLLVLLAAGYNPIALKRVATDVHGRWRHGNKVPNEHFVARLSLRQELHDSLLQDLAAAAAETRKMRIGADEKSKMLVKYARMVKPISAPDANAIFNDAVAAASELDSEVMAQIRLLNELIARGAGMFSNARWTARRVSDVVADAAIRLDGHDHFPWHESVSGLARLDCPLALANAARWDDENIVSLGESLPSLLKMALQNGSIRPAQGAAIAVFLDSDQGVRTEVLEQAGAAKLINLPALAEDAAYDILVRDDRSRNDGVTRFIERYRLDGPWTDALRRRSRFLPLLSTEPLLSTSGDREPPEQVGDPLNGHLWDREMLLDSGRLRSVINAMRDQARVEKTYLPVSVILQSARYAVLLRDRVGHLSALADLNDPTITNDASNALLEAIGTWCDSPAVQGWCRTQLPEAIVTWLPELSCYLQHGKDDLTPALKRTAMSEDELQELLLRGIERHVDGFGSEQIFALAGLVAGKLSPSDAAGLTNWYAERLAHRIPLEDRDQTAPDSMLPRDIDEAVARFLFAYMGDYDLRLRWKAAHAVRRLARAEDAATLTAFVEQYQRREDLIFRSRQLDFYWLAARLWFVLAWDRVAGECPDAAGQAGPALLAIALDDTFPHLLVRSFARDACEKLAASGHLCMNPEQKSSLGSVNDTPFARAPSAKSKRRRFAKESDGRRFEFDWMDTLPSWYEPILSAFADVDCERFLRTVEHWIIDEWGYSGNARDVDKKRRSGRFEDQNWSLSSNRSGSIPTLELLRNHLEWHAMWCAAGQLLMTDPLMSSDDGDGESWDDLGARIRRNKLTEPPLWSADLLSSIPLIACNWNADSRAVDEWVFDVIEADHRAEIFPDDQRDYVVVDGYVERRMADRIETIRVSSALVAPATGGAPLRALQSMDDSWDYKLPNEDEDQEISQGSYLLLGWLVSPNRDNGIDDKDPMRGYASLIEALPGRRVIEACGLDRDKMGRARWLNSSMQPPMFIYEAWGERATDDERYRTDLMVDGRRLLAHKAQLQQFLLAQELDLIIEVEVDRRGQENQRYDSEEEKKTPEGRFDRLYRLDPGGNIELAEGCAGTWTGDRSGA